MKINVNDLEASLREALGCDKINVAYRLRKAGVTIEIDCPSCESTRYCEEFLTKHGFTKVN